MLLESQFQSNLIKELQEKYPGAVILKNDPSYIQGIPDIIMLNGRRWIALDAKRSVDAVHQYNQDYYMDLLDSMSFARFVYPENREEVMHDIQRALQSRW